MTRSLPPCVYKKDRSRYSIKIRYNGVYVDFGTYNCPTEAGVAAREHWEYIYPDIPYGQRLPRNHPPSR